MEQSLLEGAILTGGGALLAGMCDVAERNHQLSGAQGAGDGDRELAARIG